MISDDAETAMRNAGREASQKKLFGVGAGDEFSGNPYLSSVIAVVEDTRGGW
ncbi:hypothetical protein JNN96_32995 [Mycobacterium sp. DSM 3803]|nr:hypothetical protein [Mycobacterium sp. DSM 3803]